MELDNIPTLQFFNTRIWQQPRQQITTERLQLFYLLNGDVFYSIQTWPPDIQQLFWKKLNPQETMTLSNFCCFSLETAVHQKLLQNGF